MDASDNTSSQGHPAAMDVDALLAQCRFTATRRGGPGGQHRNKIATAIVIEHQPTGTTAQASERRSQNENRKLAIFRLRINLALSQRCPIEQPYTPTPLWQSRCRGGKVRVNPGHADFPALLAEALDVLAIASFDPAKAAALLGCTATQLVNLLKVERRAIQQVNDARQALGQHALR